MDELKELLLNSAKEFSVELSEKQLDQFVCYSQQLEKWNKVMNLTAIKEPRDVVLKHFADSLAVLKYEEIKNDASIADVGCGAGFPGHPLKIAKEDITLCSIDSLGKRLKFLEDLEKNLSLTDCSCVHLRAEEAGLKAEFREKFDYSTARAVAKLSTLAEYCLPLVKVGGAFIAMKGAQAEEEINEAENAVKLLGGRIENIYEYNLPTTDNKRTIIIIRKIKNTNKNFPRCYSKISKNPL